MSGFLPELPGHRQVFEFKNREQLPLKIDWWIEHPQERIEAGQKYADFSRRFDIRYSIDSLIKMYREAYSSISRTKA